MDESIKIVFIVGPTAVGKTDWAYKWAEKDSLFYKKTSALMNSDSIQVYKELNIGAAKPDFTKHPSIPHYLFDQISAPEVWTAGLFRKQALKILKTEIPHRKIYITGGSGFYIQALEKGMYDTKALSQENLMKWEEREKKEGLNKLYELLLKQDPERAKQISSKDKYRIIRSLNLMETEEKPPSQIKKEFQEQKLPWPYLKIGLEITKEDLLIRVKKRTKNMLKKGLIDEIESLIKKGFRNWRPLNSVGYKEGLLYLEGKIKKPELFDAIVSSTMLLAKKQRTWFKKDKNIRWLKADQPALKAYQTVFQ